MGTGQTFQMIKLFLKEEFQRKTEGKDEGSIMRGNSLVTKLIKNYLNLIGCQYLIDILGNIIYTIVITEHKISLEVDPNKCSNEEEIIKNRNLLLEKLKLIVDKITSQESIDKMPSEIRIITGFFSEFAKIYVPTKVWALVGGFLILRYFNPAISSPESFGLLPEGKIPNSRTKRNLVLITKILQNLSNGIEFGKKELFLMPFNEFIKENKVKMEQYFENVTNFSSKTVITHVPDSNLIFPEDLHALHKLITQNQNIILSLFKDKDDGQKFSKLFEKLGSYESKISFSFLGNNDRKAVISLLEQYRDEAAFIGWVDKKKKNKIQKRLLVVGHSRIISVKPGGKLARQAHILELNEIKSSSTKPTELNLIFKTFSIICDTEETDKIIYCIRRAFETKFSGMPSKLKFKIDVQPESRLQSIHIEDVEPCGGFIESYKSFCNYYSIPVNEDVCWNFTNLPSRIKIFDFKRLTKTYSEYPLNLTDLGPIFRSLQFNSYFENFVIKNFKLDKDAFSYLSEAMKFNKTIKSIILSGVGGTKENFITLFDALSSNVNCAVTSLDLSNNSIEDKGMINLSNFILITQNNITFLNLSNVNASKQGFTTLFNSIKDRAKVKGSVTLHYLDISENKLFKISEIFSNSLSTIGLQLKSLLLSNTQINLQIILDSLQKNCPNIELLDISKNKIKSNDCISLINFLSSITSLTELNLSSTKFPIEYLKNILSEISKDIDLTLDISDNNLGIQGANIIASLPFKMTSINKLNLSNNDFGDEGLSVIAEGLCSCTSLKSLILDNNFKERGKQRPAFIANLIKLITSNYSLEELSIIGSPKINGAYLKQDIVPFLYALGNNKSLTSINISGHQMGNMGAIALSKALRQNQSLISIIYDKNSIGLLGFINIKNGLKANQTIKNMPLPIYDMGQVLKNEPQSIQQIRKIFNKIEKFIQRNQQIDSYD